LLPVRQEAECGGLTLKNKLPNRREVAEEVLAYFLRNARAADDLEGIVRFRLPDQRIEQRVIEVSEALAWLVSTGLVDQTTRPGTGPIFSLNEAKRRHAEKLVAGEGLPAARRRKKRPH